MSGSGSVIDEIVWRVFYVGVHTVDSRRVIGAHTPEQLEAAWRARIRTAREDGDPRRPEVEHAERLFVWLRPREEGCFSFVWMDLGQPDDRVRGDWQPVHRLADWAGNLRQDPG